MAPHSVHKPPVSYTCANIIRRGPTIVWSSARRLVTIAIMAPKPILPRDCYSAYEVRRLFGRRDERGVVKPISRMTLKRWRQKGLIPFIVRNCRVIDYPRAGVDSLLGGVQQ